MSLTSGTRKPPGRWWNRGRVVLDLMVLLLLVVVVVVVVLVLVLVLVLVSIIIFKLEMGKIQWPLG